MFKTNEKISKSTGLLLLIGISSSAWADLPDPQTCGQDFPKGVVIQYQTKAFFSNKLKAEKFTLHFYKSGEFTYSDTKAGVEHETIDGSQLRETGNHGFLTGVDLHCADPGKLHSCAKEASFFQDLVDRAIYTQVVSQNRAELKRQSAALECASSISLSFMMKSIQLHARRIRVPANKRFTLASLNPAQEETVNNSIEKILHRDGDDGQEERSRSQGGDDGQEQRNRSQEEGMVLGATGVISGSMATAMGAP